MKQPLVKFIKRVAAVALLAPGLAFAAAGLQLDRAPVSTNQAALQHGAKIFVNYCLNCHSASFMRYNRLTDIGLSEQMIIDNLMFAGNKVGDLMTVSMRPSDARVWFGVVPPDLTLVARARASESGTGADWLYTYLRGFYRDDERPTGWNNVIFPNVGMPHALWELQGTQVMKPNAEGHAELSLAQPGTMSVEEYNKTVADLVSFLVWMGEPVAEKRKAIGTFVLIFLAGFFVLAYALKKNFWKDVH